jgi:uncharacterized protein DUF1844
MEREKKPEFVVTDRRKFTVEGEPRPDAPVESSSPASTPATPAEPSSAAAKPPQPPQATPQQPAPTKQEKPAAKQESAAGAKREASPASGPDLATGYSAERERASFGGQKMEFVHLLDMLVQTAMMYAGAMDTGAERRVDVVGLRQMIDLIAVLQEKSKGNLSEQEEAVLKNTLFQLRMTYMEIVNMIDRQAMQKEPGVAGPGPKGPARK